MAKVHIQPALPKVPPGCARCPKCGAIRARGGAIKNHINHCRVTPRRLQTGPIMALLLLVALLAPAARACGTERWAIKTLADPVGAELLRAPGPVQPATLGELIAFPAPARKQLLAAKGFRWPQEQRLYRVEALLIGYKAEADGDFHLVLADADDRTVVGEIPSSDCFDGNGWQTQAEFTAAFSKPTAKFKRLDPPVKVELIGVGFFDFIHGQTGVAPNGFELHPILRITREQ